MSKQQQQHRRVLVPLGDGSEEIEAMCIIDVLRRAGADVCVASVSNERRVVMSRQVVIECDRLITEIKDDEVFDLIVLPGGMPGAQNLSDCRRLIQLLKQQKQQHRMYAAICAAPAVVLHQHGLLKGMTATCFPSFLPKLVDCTPSEERVVITNNNQVITSRGPGTALEFSLTLVGLLYNDPQKRDKLAQSMLVRM